MIDNVTSVPIFRLISIRGQPIRVTMQCGVPLVETMGRPELVTARHVCRRMVPAHLLPIRVWVRVQCLYSIAMIDHSLKIICLDYSK